MAFLGHQPMSVSTLQVDPCHLEPLPVMLVHYGGPSQRLYLGLTSGLYMEQPHAKGACWSCTAWCVVRAMAMLDLLGPGKPGLTTSFPTGSPTACLHSPNFRYPLFQKWQELFLSLANRDLSQVPILHSDDSGTQAIWTLHRDRNAINVQIRAQHQVSSLLLRASYASTMKQPGSCSLFQLRVLLH